MHVYVCVYIYMYIHGYESKPWDPRYPTYNSWLYIMDVYSLKYGNHPHIICAAQAAKAPPAPAAELLQ